MILTCFLTCLQCNCAFALQLWYPNRRSQSIWRLYFRDETVQENTRSKSQGKRLQNIDSEGQHRGHVRQLENQGTRQPHTRWTLCHLKIRL